MIDLFLPSAKFVAGCVFSEYVVKWHVILCTFWGSLLSSSVEPYHMPFCSQSKPQIDFAVLSSSHLRCVDLCKVILLCLWILCSILSVRQGTIHGLLMSSKSLLLFVLFIIIIIIIICFCSIYYHNNNNYYYYYYYYYYIPSCEFFHHF